MQSGILHAESNAWCGGNNSVIDNVIAAIEERSASANELSLQRKKTTNCGLGSSCTHTHQTRLNRLIIGSTIYKAVYYFSLPFHYIDFEYIIKYYISHRRNFIDFLKKIITIMLKLLNIFKHGTDSILQFNRIVRTTIP